VVIGGSSGAQSLVASYYPAIRANDLPGLQASVVAGGVEVRDERGRTPLMHAAAVGSLDAVRLLLERGASVNTADAAGVTPLMFAARDAAKVRLLLERGADPNAKSKLGQTAMLIAAASPGSLEILRALADKGGDPKAIGAAGRTGVTVSALAGDLEAVQFFLDRGVDVNATFRSDKEGNTPLMLASAQLNVPMAAQFLKRGADPNAATKAPGGGANGPSGLGGLTALGMAVPYGSPELVRTLLDGGARADVRDNRGLTPLMLAVASENQDPEVVRMLLAAGADPAVKSEAGETALDWARKYANPATLALFKSGATPPPTSGSGKPVTVSDGELRSMLQTSTDLLLQSSKKFATQRGCLGCHHQYVTEMAVAAVRPRGIPVDETLASELSRSITANLRSGQNSHVQRLDGGGLQGSTLYTMAALRAAKHPADESTDSAAVYLLARQRTDGRWPRDDVSRTPLDDAHVNRAALSVAAIATYAPPALKAEKEEHLRRARAWFTSVRPRTTDDHAMRVFGLHYSGGSNDDVRSAAKALLALQRPDGGWAPSPYLASDAYATSQALWVLAETGTAAVTDSSYRRGIQFLLQTRAPDGTWYVRSRAPKFQPYFESGFPYGHDQWISAAATARAVIVLAGTLR
jgi:ankyrin repeat protein